MLPARRALLAIGLTLAACQPAPSPAIPTSRPSLPPPAITIVQLPTAIPPSATPLPTETAAPAAEATPTPLPPCTHDATFLNDLTIPDGKQYLPGQSENKKWLVANSGTCDWGPDYRLVLVSGDALGSPTEVALYPARGGADAVYEIRITAPEAPGQYTGRWKARTPDGQLFGDTVFVKIEVIGIPTAAP